MLLRAMLAAAGKNIMFLMYKCIENSNFYKINFVLYIAAANFVVVVLIL